MTEVVKFNVGGQPYQVSRSLLAQHPNTTLARSASKQWQKDPESEVFIERDGEMFRHVLNYLRDGGKVKLPLTVTKDGFLLELEYYCVDGIDERNVDDSLIMGSQIIHGLDHMNEVRASLEIEGTAMLFAALCIKGIYHLDRCRRSEIWTVRVKALDPDYNLVATFINRTRDAARTRDAIHLHYNGTQDAVNVHLIKVGLKVKEISYTGDIVITLIPS